MFAIIDKYAKKASKNMGAWVYLSKNPFNPFGDFWTSKTFVFDSAQKFHF